MIKVGIIGCGAITQRRHAPEYAENPDVQIAGFFDVVRERAESLVHRYGGRIYDSYQSMLADREIDAVSMCVANRYHAPIALEALNAGKHVLCEKPMATSLEDAERMIRAAEENQRFLMIGHNQRLVPAHIRAKELIKRGEIGRVLSFHTTFGHSGPESWSVEKGAHTWFFKKKDAFMGVMGDLGIHKADLIRWLIDDEIAEVQALVATLDKRDEKGNFIDVDDNAICILKSRKGIIGTLTASWTYYGEENNSTVLYGTDGYMKICDHPDYPIMIVKKNKERVYYKVGGIQTNDNQTKSGVIDMFIRSIKNNTPPEISGWEGLQALKIVFACLESAQKGMTVKIS